MPIKTVILSVGSCTQAYKCCSYNFPSNASTIESNCNSTAPCSTPMRIHMQSTRLNTHMMITIRKQRLIQTLNESRWCCSWCLILLDLLDLMALLLMIWQRRLPNLTVAWEEGRVGKETAISNEGSRTDGVICWK